MDDTRPVILRRDGAVAHLRFNRPQALNAINSAMAKAILAASEELAQDRGVRAVVLSGEGKGFMAGGDLAEMQADPQAIASRIIDPLHAALIKLASLDAPVIASVHGVVAGAGVSLMLGADLAIAAQGTRFNLAYLNIGASCDGGASFALPRIVGLRNAEKQAFDACAASPEFAEGVRAFFEKRAARFQGS